MTIFAPRPELEAAEVKPAIVVWLRRHPFAWYSTMDVCVGTGLRFGAFVPAGSGGVALVELAQAGYVLCGGLLRPDALAWGKRSDPAGAAKVARLWRLHPDHEPQAGGE